MKKSTLFIVLYLFIFCSCSEKKTETNKDLIYFDSKFLAEFGDDRDDELEKKLNNDFEVKYLNDIIYISKIIETNACGSYEGDFEIKNDSLILKYSLISDELCDSKSIERVTYIVKNPTEKKYKFKLKYE